jgi:hypothetical protein
MLVVPLGNNELEAIAAAFACARECVAVEDEKPTMVPARARFHKSGLVSAAR